MKCSGCNSTILTGFDWRFRIERGVVDGRTGDVKTVSSRKKLPLDQAVVFALKNLKLQTHFAADGDFVFASPRMFGKQPVYGYSAQRDHLTPAAIRAGLGPIGWHSLRHSYRTWLDESDAPISVQRERMRHSTISMTMDRYGRGERQPTERRTPVSWGCCSTRVSRMGATGASTNRL